MKKFLLIMAIGLLLMGCGEKKVEEGYADAGLVRQGWQINIYETTINADYRGIVEEGNDTATVEALREEAEEIDSLLVSCFIIMDAQEDTIIDMFDIK